MSAGPLQRAERALPGGPAAAPMVSARAVPWPGTPAPGTLGAHEDDARAFRAPQARALAVRLVRPPGGRGPHGAGDGAPDGHGRRELDEHPADAHPQRPGAAPDESRARPRTSG